MVMRGYDPSTGERRAVRVLEGGIIPIQGSTSVEGLEYLGGEKIQVSTSMSTANLPNGTNTIIIVGKGAIYYRINGNATTDGPGYLPADTVVVLKVKNSTKFTVIGEGNTTAYLQYFK